MVISQLRSDSCNAVIGVGVSHLLGAVDAG